MEFRPAIIPFSVDLAAIRAGRKATLQRHAAAQPPITAALSIPRRVDVGGRSLTITELRLIDLAELQAWIEEGDHPLDGFDPMSDGPERLARLREAWAASACWPTRLGTPEASALLARLGGLVTLLRLVTRRYQSDLTDAELAEIVIQAKLAEWSALRRVAWGVSPRSEIVNLVAPDLTPGAGIDWRLAIYRVIEAHGLTFEQVGELTLNQWGILGSGGKSSGKDESYPARFRRARLMLEGG